MKKILPLLALLLVVLAAVIWLKKPQDSAPAPEGAAAEGSSDQAIYSVRVDIRQRTDSGEAPAMGFAATLAQHVQAEGEFVSQWEAIEELSMMGQAVAADVRDGLLRKAVLSSYDSGESDFAHYLPQDFPAPFVPFQLSFMRKVLLPFPLEQLKEGTVSRTENDEAGSYRAEYVIRPTGDGFEVNKIWQQYLAAGVKVDAEENSLHYVLAKDGRLVSLDGRVTLHYRQPQPAHFSSEIHVRRKGSQAKAGTARVAKEQMKKTDARDMAPPTANDPNRMSFGEAMTKLDAISDKSDSAEVYNLFSTLKAEVIRDPSLAREVFDKIRKTSERDPSSKRRLTVLFGALAQSEATEIAETLANEVQQCPDSFCKVQSIVGVSDHPHPNEASAEKMLEIGRNSSDAEIAGTALLAAGSIGRKLDDSLPQLPQALISELNNPAKAEIKSTVLAAMGNHGNPEYLASLENYARSSKDVSAQASAVYSLRYLPQESVNQTLLSVLSESKNKNVMAEAYKAIEYRNLSAEQYHDLAKNSAALSDRDLAQAAARVLLQAYRDDPKLEGALETLRNETKVPDVRDYLDGEKKRLEELKKNPNSAE